MTDQDRRDLISQALGQAARAALEAARAGGTNLVLWMDGKPVEVSPEDIEKFVERHRDGLFPSREK